MKPYPESYERQLSNDASNDDKKQKTGKERTKSMSISSYTSHTNSELKLSKQYQIN